METIKFIRGVKGRGKDVKKVLEGLGGIDSNGPDEDYEYRDFLYYVDNKEMLWYVADSCVGRMILERGEEILLPAKYKYNVGDKIKYLRYNPARKGVIGIIKSRERKGDKLLYYCKSENCGPYSLDEVSEQDVIERVETWEEKEGVTWEDLAGRPVVEAYFIDDHSDIVPYDCDTYYSGEKYVAASVKVAKSMLAMAQISCLFPYYGGIITDNEWKDDGIDKYVITRQDNELDMEFHTLKYHFLAFHTSEQRDKFLTYNKQLVLDYLMLDRP